MDGTRVRGVPQVDPVFQVAWHPSVHMLAFCNEDARAPRPEHFAVRVLVPAP
jgi:hypothetical protein